MARLAGLAFLVVSQFNDDDTPQIGAPTNTTAASSTSTPTPQPTATTVESAQGVATPTATSFANITTGDTETPTSTVEPDATNTANVIETNTPTQTQAPTDTPVPSDTPTAEPTDTPVPTETQEPTDTATAVPSETSEPTDTVTAEPTDTDVPESTETMAPSETSEPTQTATPPPTDTPVPTDTATEEPSVKPQPTDTPTETATATETATEIPPATPVATDTPKPTKTPKPEPTDTPEPTATPTQPPIVPRGGDTEPADATEVPQEEPTEEPAEQPTAEATDTGIEPTDNTAVPEEETPAPPDETATNQTTAAEVTLADAEKVFDLPGGVSSPTGPMAISSGLDSAIVYQDGQLAFMDFSGNIIPIAAGTMPMWSPLGQLVLYQNATEAQSSAIATWDLSDGSIYQVTGNEQPEGGSVSDVPAGWIDANLYYLRIFNERPGYVELHQWDWNGESDSLIWSHEDVNLAADHPISTGEAILIPTDSTWLSITPDGNEAELGANTTGAVGDALISPFGTLIVYVGGGQLNVAPIESPGSVQAVIPFPDGGFDISYDGEQIVTAGSDGLVTFDIDDGTQLNFIANGEGMHATAPAWTSDGILFMDIGAEPAMRRYAI
jgi:hypothetical protein